MSWAQDLWLTSCSLAAVSVATMAGLVIARVVGLGFRRRRDQARAYWFKALLGEAAGQRPPGWWPGSNSQLAELSTELIQLVRGSDRVSFIARAESIGVPELLRRQLAGGGARTRVSAAEALAEFPGERSARELNAALSDRSPEVRLAAAISLAAIDAAPPARALIAKLGIGTRENSRLVVGLFRDIGRVRPGEIEEIVTGADVPAGARGAAIESLASLGDYRLVPLITKIVLHSPADAPELPRYVRSLAGYAHPAAEPAIRKVLQSPNWEARAAGARAAGRIGLPSLAAELRALLGDPEWWVRFRAGEALTRLGDPGLRVLREAAGAKSGLARAAASLTLAERGLC